MALDRKEFVSKSNRAYYFFGDTNNTIFTYNGKYYNPMNGFSDDLYKAYTKSGNYKLAAEYGSMFYYKDPTLQEQHSKDIKALKNYANIQNKLYENATSIEDKWAMDFSSKILNGNGLQNILDIDNSYYKDYTAYRNLLVTPEKNIFRGEYSDEIGITFHKHREMSPYADKIGMAWHDFISGIFGTEQYNRGNDFLKNIGETAESLRTKGFNVEEANGELKIRVRKDNELFDNFLYKLASDTNIRQGNDFELTGYRNGNELSLGWHDKDWNKNYNDDYNNPLYRMKLIIDDANSRQQQISDSVVRNRHSSTLYGYLNPEVADCLEKIRLDGSADNVRQQKELMGQLQSVYTNQIINGALDQVELYSDKYNEGNDHSLNQLDDSAHREEVRRELMAAIATNDVYYSIQESDGRFGVIATVLPKMNSNGVIIKEGFSVWGKGLLEEDCLNVIGDDSTFSAIKELNEIEKYNLDYDYDDNYKIITKEVEDGINHVPRIQYYKVDKASGREESIDKTEVLKHIEERTLIDDAYYQLLYENTNISGNILDYNLLMDGVPMTTDAQGNLTSRGRLGMKQAAVMIANGLANDGEIITVEDLNADPDTVPYKKGTKISKAQEILQKLIKKFAYLSRG